MAKVSISGEWRSPGLPLWRLFKSWLIERLAGDALVMINAHGTGDTPVAVDARRAQHIHLYKCGDVRIVVEMGDLAQVAAETGTSLAEAGIVTH